MEEENNNSFLTFQVNGALYGVSVTRVVEIQAYAKPDATPSGLPYMLGLTQHRGSILPLIDSSAKFGMQPIQITPQTYVVVIAVKNADELFDVALAVDEVREVVNISDDKKMKIDSTYKPGYVAFASNTNAGLVMALDPDKVFTDTDVISMADISAQANKANLADKQ